MRKLKYFLILLILGFYPAAARAEQDCSMEVVTGIPQSECEVLIHLYNTTGGSNWNNNYIWDTLIPASEWKGITVENGHVTEISVSSQEKEGSLFPELERLFYLREFEFKGGSLEGFIPPELGNLENLEVLDLRDNNLSGNIPPELANIRNLAKLRLSNTKVSGPIPTELTNLRKLISLNLSDTRISGPIPPGFGDVISLQYLGLSRTGVSGSIPPELGKLRYLTGLYLNDTDLSGSIPPEFGGLTKILTMNLSGNNLTGSIPPDLGNLRELRYLYLNNNNLEGSLSPDLGKMRRIDTLNLSYNQLEGLIPPEFSKLGSMWILDISHNSLEGDLPPEIGSIDRLHDLDLSYNQITSAPPELGNLDNLSHLDLSHNQLSGTIPAQWGNLPILNYLILNDNQLSGPIPAEIGNISHLSYLDFNRNQLSGPLPSEIENMDGLRILYLGENQITGGIPPEWGNMANLRELRLGGNQLTGPIPSEIMNLTDLNEYSFPNYYHSDVSYNALYADDSEVKTFMDEKFPGWELTQTVAPENLRAENVEYFPSFQLIPGESNRIRFSWDPILYQGNDGGYEICLQETIDGSCLTGAGITADKEESSILLSGLKPDVEYFFSVVSKSFPLAYRNPNIVTSLPSDTVTIHTGETAVTAFPLWDMKPGAYTGLAFSNYGTGETNLALTAYDETGQTQTLPVNPSLLSVGMGEQSAGLGSELFGITNITEKLSWVEAASDQLVGSFFTFGSSDMRMLDGAITQSQPSRHLYFTRPLPTGVLSGQGETGQVSMALVNPLENPVETIIGLIQGGETISEVSRTITSKGLLLTTSGELFGADSLPVDCYLEVETTAGEGVIGFSRVDFSETGTTLALNAAEPSSAETLYSAQLASGPGAGGSGMETHIRLVNPMEGPRAIIFTAVAEDGSLLAEPVTRTLCGKCVMEEAAWDLFAFTGESAIGSLVVDAKGGGIIGDVVFTPFEGIEYAAAMPLQTRPVTEAVFNHIANSDEIFTGLALFNPSEKWTQITIVAKKGDGTVSGTKQILMGPGRRISRVLNDPDMLPGTASQLDGFISISSTQPIICQQLFGSTDLRFLAAVPPTTGYGEMF
jgi:Leucine-rich repeat (LRR) protein